MAISAQNVRDRGQWDNSEISDTLLASKAFIPMGDAWIAKKLESAGLSYAAMDANDQALADAAEIAAVAAVTAQRMARGEFKTGLLSIKDVDSTKMGKFAAELREEAKSYLSMLGVLAEGGFHFESKGGDDYTPDASDETQIDFTEADTDTPFSVWP